MEILLERILSLVPKKHGGDKEFALSIGYKSGNVIADWKAGRSFSYKNKVQEIAKVYNVSSEWLYGETDQKEKSPAPEGVELTDLQKEAMEFVKTMNEEQLRQFIMFGKAMSGE